MGHLRDIMHITKGVVEEMKLDNRCQWTEEYPNEDTFRTDIENNHMYVYVENNKVLGYVVIDRNENDEYKKHQWNGDNYLVIHRMAVDLNTRHQGISTKLFDFAKDLAKEQHVEVLKTDTFSKNVNMNKNFLRQGFRFVGEVFFYVSDEPFYCYEYIVGE